MSELSPVLNLASEALQCPYGYYDKAREAGSVVYDQAADVYVITRHEDIAKVNTSPKTFSNQNPMGPTQSAALTAVQDALSDASPEFAERAATVMRRGDVLFTADPPDHTRHRKLLNKAMTPKAVAQIEDDIERICNDLVDSFIDAGEVDLVSQFSTPAPVRALAQLLGVPGEKAADFTRWAEAINASIGTEMSRADVLQAIEDQMEFWDYFEREISDRAENPRGDLLTAVAQARGENDERLTLNEMVGFASQLIGAGADTTTKLISSAMLLLCRDAELMSRVRNHPEDIPRFLEEALRLDAPVQGLFRVTTEDIDVDGVHIPAGKHVWVLYASGNYDESVFSCPAQTDIDRDKLRSHLGFGHGPHSCIGAPLARSVARISFETMLSRMANLELPSTDWEPEFDPSYVMRGMRSLPLRFTKIQ